MIIVSYRDYHDMSKKLHYAPSGIIRQSSKMMTSQKSFFRILGIKLHSLKDSRKQHRDLTDIT